jgi:hypothetical protein
LPLPAASERLPDAGKLRQVGAIALAQDSRSAIMTTARKISFVNKVINHVVDGDTVPKDVFDKDEARPENTCLVDLWRLAEKAVRAKCVELGIARA